MALGDGLFYRQVRLALEAGIDWIQLREKFSPTSELLKVAEKLIRLPREPHQRIIVNDRLDVAMAMEFDGVHLGGDSLPVRVVRQRLKTGFLIGKSCHHLQEAQRAEVQGADYVIFGPIFETPSKLKYGPPRGIRRLHRVTKNLSIPVLAIGGINLANAGQCLDAGAAGLAAISLFQTTSSIKSVLNSLRSMGSAYS